MLPLGIRNASASISRVPRKIASAGKTPMTNARMRTASDARGQEWSASRRVPLVSVETCPFVMPPDRVPAESISAVRTTTFCSTNRCRIYRVRFSAGAFRNSNKPGLESTEGPRADLSGSISHSRRTTNNWKRTASYVGDTGARQDVTSPGPARRLCPSAHSPFTSPATYFPVRVHAPLTANDSVTVNRRNFLKTSAAAAAASTLVTGRLGALVLPPTEPLTRAAVRRPPRPRAPRHRRREVRRRRRIPTFASRRTARSSCRRANDACRVSPTPRRSAWASAPS